MNVSKWIASVKQALTYLDDVEESLPFMDNMTSSELVMLGQRLWFIIKRSNKILDRIKVRLREEAGNPHSAVHFDGEDKTHCLVIPQSPVLDVRKDADIKKLKDLLRDDFDIYFEEVVSHHPRKDFDVRTSSCAPDVQQVLFDAVNVNERTHRVVFKD